MGDMRMNVREWVAAVAVVSLVGCAGPGHSNRAADAEPVKVIFDTDMYTDFDDAGALACLHALADAGECEILATISNTRGCNGELGRSAWDETAVLIAVRGTEPLFNVHRGTFRMVGDKGEDEWVPDEENGPHLRVTEKVNKLEVGKVIDELICRKPLKRK